MQAASYVIYQLWFHPLAKYPGPFWARISNLYAAHHAWKGDLHLDMWRMHLKYGKYHVSNNPHECLAYQ